MQSKQVMSVDVIACINEFTRSSSSPETFPRCRSLHLPVGSDSETRDGQNGREQDHTADIPQALSGAGEATATIHCHVHQPTVEDIPPG